MYKEKTLHENNKKLSELNFNLKKTLKFFENYFYNSMEIKNRHKVGKKDRTSSLPESLTDIWQHLKQRYRQETKYTSKKGKKHPKRDLG